MLRWSATLVQTPPRLGQGSVEVTAQPLSRRAGRGGQCPDDDSGAGWEPVDAFRGEVTETPADSVAHDRAAYGTGHHEPDPDGEVGGHALGRRRVMRVAAGWSDVGSADS